METINFKEDRINWLDLLKGIAIILVVIRHVMQSNIVDCSYSMVGNIIYAIQMPLFMIISGYFSITYNSYYTSFNNLKKYIRKRFLRYMLPFFSWFILIDVILCGKYNRNIIKAVKCLINNVDVGFWFLYVVFILSLILVVSKWTCYKFTKNAYALIILPLLLEGALLTPLYLIALKKGLRFLGINLIIFYYIYFAIGSFLAGFKIQINNVLKIRAFRYSLLLISLIIFSVICTYKNIELSDDSIINIFYRVTAGITGSIIVTYLAYWISLKECALMRILIQIGKYTLEIYVVHVQFIGIIPKGEHYFNTFDGQIIFLISLLITSILTFITVNVIKKIPIGDFILFGNNKAFIKNDKK